MIIKASPAARAAAIFLAGISAMAGCAPETAHHAEISERAARYAEDFEYLTTTLNERHPDMYHERSPEAFDDDLQAILEKADSLSDFDMMMELRFAIASLGDAHTSVAFYDEIDPRGWFPIETAWFEEGLTIIGAGEAYPELLGARIAAIDGKPIAKILADLSRLTPKSDPYFARKRQPWFITSAGLLQYFGTIDDGEAVFTVAGADGETRDVTVRAEFGEMGPESPLVYQSEVTGHPTWINPNEDRMDLMFRDIFYPETGVYLVQYNSCWGRELEEKYGDAEKAKTYPAFEAFKARIMERLGTGEVKSLIFDLRANGGGSSPQGTQLAKDIAALAPPARPESIYTAISEFTFSSAVINAMNFKQELGAVFLGTPTGGKPNHFGEVRVFELPNSGVKIAHSTKYFQYLENEDPPTIAPDQRIETSLADFASGRDPVLEYVKGELRE